MRRFLTLGFCTLVLGACGGAAPSSDASGDDAAVPDASPAFAPGPHSAAPTITSAGGAVDAADAKGIDVFEIVALEGRQSVWIGAVGNRGRARYPCRRVR